MTIDLNWANHPQLRTVDIGLWYAQNHQKSQPTEPATADQLVDPWQEFGKPMTKEEIAKFVRSSAGATRKRPARKRTRKSK